MSLNLLSTIAYILALLLLLQAAGLSLLLLVASEMDEKQTDGGGGEIDWKWGLAVSCVCARSGGREGADQRRKNIKGKRGKSPNGSRQREEREGQANLPALFISFLATYRYVLTVAPSAQMTCHPSLFHR